MRSHGHNIGVEQSEKVFWKAENNYVNIHLDNLPYKEVDTFS